MLAFLSGPAKCAGSLIELFEGWIGKETDLPHFPKVTEVAAALFTWSIDNWRFWDGRRQWWKEVMFLKQFQGSSLIDTSSSRLLIAPIKGPAILSGST